MLMYMDMYKCKCRCRCYVDVDVKVDVDGYVYMSVSYKDAPLVNDAAMIRGVPSIVMIVYCRIVCYMKL